MAAEVPEKSEPKYYLVKRHLLGLLPDFSPGVPLPTERELASSLSTSRSTVRQALTELVVEGRLVRRHGSGTYVAEPKLAWPLQMSSFTEQAASSGLVVESSIVSSQRIRATDELAELLRLKPGAPVHRLERLRKVNGAPMALEQSHLSAARFPGLARSVRRTGSLYHALADQWGVKVVGAVETIETVPASPREAGLLDTDVGAPMMMLSRHSFDAASSPVEWVRSWYRGDRYKFVATLGFPEAESSLTAEPPRRPAVVGSTGERVASARAAGDVRPGAIMNAEIEEQPDALSRLWSDQAAEIRGIRAQLARRDHRFVLLAARGTSDHAALYAKYLVEVYQALPAGLVSPSTSTVYDARPDLTGVLYLAVSQSGGSPDLVGSLAVARECGATTVAVTNNVDSELAGVAEFVLDVRAGAELAVAATKSYTTELLALHLLLGPVGPPDEAAGGIARLVDAARATLQSPDAVAAAAARYRFATRLVTTARGFSYATAREAALKLMETSYLGAHAFSGADLLHGPMAMIDADTPVIAVATPGRGGAAMVPVLGALRERGADLVLVGGTPEAVAAAPRAAVLPVRTDGVAEELLPILEILPLQQLALRLALERGVNPDAPRGLRKVTETW